jgi:serine/threonine protein kinase/Flp pilus assembly protein TadD
MPETTQRIPASLDQRYAIERELGRGGMATVYLARDRKHNRPLAVKILHPHLAAHLGAERFLREIEIAARLSHPHILTLIDSGEADGLLYFVMPFVDGESLRQRMSREGRLATDQALAITRQVANALGYAHARGVVHRDIKPENVMLHEGEAIVTDFGIAKAIGAADSASLTQTGTAVGTPAYMSPEQAGGEAELDGRSDLYSLGCMLYEMLAGSPPFTGPTPQAVLVRRLTEAPPALRSVRPDLPETLDRALAKAMARNPADRFATVTLFAQALPSLGASTPPGATAAATAAAVKSIAVLPFTDMSPERDQEYFTDGIAEEIINALTRIQALQVASRSSAFAIKGKNQDIRKVGEQLGVATVLEGSVRKAGNRLRITAQLVNVADGYQLWSERYDRELEDVFAVQDEIAESIVKALRVVLSENEKRALGRPRTENVQAYEYYLKGRQYFHQFRGKSYRLASRMFERAIEHDPDFVQAYAGMADCSSFLFMYSDARAANLEQADAASMKALELAPDLAEAHASRGLALTLRKRYDEAEREFEVAIALDPKLFEAHYFFARVCLQQGKLEQAAARFQKASEVRPEDFQTPNLLAMAYAGLGRREDSIKAYRKSLEIIERHVDLNPDDARALYLGANCWVVLENRERALEWADRALTVDAEDPGVLYNVGCVYSLLGETDRALASLEQAVLNGFGHKEWLENDSDLNSLRSLPRFQTLLAGM